MECQSSLDPAVLSGFTGISDADLQNSLNLDLADIDFDDYLNLDHAETDTNMKDSDGRLSLPGPGPLIPNGGKSVIDSLPASYAWTEGDIGKQQSPANQQLTAPQAVMSKYQPMHPWTQSHAFAPQPIPGVIYDRHGRVLPPSKWHKGEVSRWVPVPCAPPSQLLNTQVGSQFTPINAGNYLPGHPGKQTLPFVGSHLTSLAPQMGNPTVMQSIRDCDHDAASILQRQGKLPTISSPEADEAYPAPKFVAINHQPEPKSDTKSRTTKKPRIRKPLLLTKPNPRYAPHPKYNPVSNPPAPWSFFSYTTDGELPPSRLYTSFELHNFLFAHPRPQTLVLRIHRNAPDSRHRYPTTHSHRCRFTTCPMYPNNTINQGHIAVSISEEHGGEEGRERDPFLVAGWVHLWCAERFLDFVRVGRVLRVEADTREMPWERRGRNPFQLATPEEEKCVRDFIKSCRSSAGGYGLPGYPPFNIPNRPHEGTLTHRLACIKLKREPSGVSKQRDLREKVAGYRGSTLDVHMGDLEVERRVRGWTRRHGNQNQVVVKPMVPRKYKGVKFVRGVKDEEDEDEEMGMDKGDEDAEGETEEEGEEPVWAKAAREPVFECVPQKRGGGKKGNTDDNKIAAEKVESSDEDEDDSAEEDEEEDDALEQQQQTIRSGKRAKTEAESDEEEESDDDVVVPSRKRARK